MNCGVELHQNEAHEVRIVAHRFEEPTQVHRVWIMVENVERLNVESSRELAHGPDRHRSSPELDLHEPVRTAFGQLCERAQR